MNYIVDNLDYFSALLLQAKRGNFYTNPEGSPYVLFESGDRLSFASPEIKLMESAESGYVASNKIQFKVDQKVPCYLHLIADEYEDEYVIALQCKPFSKSAGSDILILKTGCITADLNDVTT